MAVVAQQQAAQADGIRHEANGGEGEGLRNQKTKRRRVGADRGQGTGEKPNRPRQVAGAFEFFSHG